MVERIDERYCQLLRDANALDYCDLITRTIEVIDGDAATAEDLRRWLAYLLVDEFYDISLEQYRLLTLLVPARSGDLWLVRGRRHAPAPALLRGIPAREFRLTTNFRSRAAIVAAADALLGDARSTQPSHAAHAGGHRPAWCLHADGAREAAAVAQLIRRAVASGHHSDYGDFAVLDRTHAIGDASKAELLQAEIPVWRVQRQ